MKYVHDPKAVEEANEPTSWRSTVPIQHLEIPPSLQPKDKPQDGDLCVFSWRESYALFRCRRGAWFKREDDPRIVGAVCCANWQWTAQKINNEATSYSEDGSTFTKRKEFYDALEKADAWRQFAGGK